MQGLGARDWGLGLGTEGKRANQMANGKWQISNGCPFAICDLPFEF
jgi:hypothetical protein